MEEVAVEEVKFVQLTGEMEPLMEKVRHTLYVYVKKKTFTFIH